MTMSKAEMQTGLARGGRLCQEEWADESEIAAVEELIAEGHATATQWEYHGNYQCKRRYVIANNELCKAVYL